MIRLCCLAEVMENLNKEEAKALCLNNGTFIELLKVLPWCYPSKSWYEICQAQMLSNIPVRYVIQSHEYREKLTGVKANRIKKNTRMPQAYIINGHQYHDEEWYIKTMKAFYYTILGKIQLGMCAPEPDDAPPIYKLYKINSITREDKYLLPAIAMGIDRHFRESCITISSLPELGVAPLVREYNQCWSISKGEYLKNLDRYSYYKTTKSQLNELCDAEPLKSNITQYNKVYEEHQYAVDVLYDFLYRCSVHGHMNDSLVEAEYEIYFY